MMAPLPRLCLARLFAVLAIILMAGLGQHLHAAEALDRTAVLGQADTGHPGGDGGKAIPSDAHCAACHLVRATMPDTPDLHEPALLRIDRVRPGEALQPDLAVPDGPARPPRHLRTL